MQFGADPRLATQCVLLPPPSGYRPWVAGIDGPMPPELRERARRFAAEEPLGATLATSSSTHPPVLIQVEPQIWQENADGSVSRGCFQVGAIYVPFTAAEKVAPPATPSRTKLEVAVGVLTVVSLTVGTLVTLSSWRKKHRK